MHATMALLAIIFPDWNSLESVRRTHSNLEVAALVFFALLVVFEALSHRTDDKKKAHVLDTFGIVFFAIAVLAEIAAYPYGQRNDELSQLVIISLDAKAQDASDAADRAKTAADGAATKAESVSKKADQAQLTLDAVGRKAKSLEEGIKSARKKLLEDGPRTDMLLAKPEALRDIKAALSPFAGQKVLLRTLSTARPETYQLETLLFFILHHCKWIAVVSKTQVQVPAVMVDISDDATESTRRAASALGISLKDAGLIYSRPVETTPPSAPDAIPPDVIVLWVGEHP